MKSALCKGAHPGRERRTGPFPSALLLAAALLLSVFFTTVAPAGAKVPADPTRTAAQPSAGKEIRVQAHPNPPALPGTSSKRNTAALKRFSLRAFRLDPLPPPSATALRLPPSVAAASSGNPSPRKSGETGEESSSLLASKRLKLSGNTPAHPESRMEADNVPLPGGRHTLSHEESAAAPEMSMSLKMNDTASARFALNPQDESSPLYSPLMKDNGLSATGLYFDLDMGEGMQLQLGGEVRSVGSESLNSSEEESAGASVGLRWSF